MDWKANAIGAFVVAAAVGMAGGADADPVTIRVGWAQTPGHLAPLIEELGKREPAIFKHRGASYDFQAIRFNGSTPQIQAQAIGELEVAAYAPSSLALAISNAKLDVRVVADVLQDGYDGYFSQYYVVRADGPIKKIEDVKGRRIATNTIGSASDAAMRTMFQRHGVKDAEFNTIETNFANMPAMLEGDKVDLIAVLPQFAKGIIGNDKYRVLFTARDAVGPTQAVMWAMRADFIAAHRPAVVDFLEDDIRAVRWFLDPAHHDAALDIASTVTKLPKDALSYAFTKNDTYRSPDAMPEMKSVQKEIDEAVELKVLPVRVEISPRYIDLSLVEEAKRRVDGK